MTVGTHPGRASSPMQGDLAAHPPIELRPGVVDPRAELGDVRDERLVRLEPLGADDAMVGELPDGYRTPSRDPHARHGLGSRSVTPNSRSTQS